MNKLHPTFLEAPGVVGLSWLTPLQHRTEAVVLDWQTGVVVPLFKYRDQRAVEPQVQEEHFRLS